MDKKKFLFGSLDGLIADIAWQVVKEGHEVKLHIDPKDEREIADGFGSSASFGYLAAEADLARLRGRSGP